MNWEIKGWLDHHFDVCNNKSNIYVCNNGWIMIYLCRPTKTSIIKIKLPKITPRNPLKSIETPLTKLRIFGQHMTLYLLNIVISGLPVQLILSVWVRRILGARAQYMYQTGDYHNSYVIYGSLFFIMNECIATHGLTVYTVTGILLWPHHMRKLNTHGKAWGSPKLTSRQLSICDHV